MLYSEWPPKVYAIFNKALDDLEQDDTPLLFGPAHVVWEDENFNSARSCLDSFEEFSYPDYSPEQLAIVRRSLEELDALPESDKEEEPEEHLVPCTFI